MVATRRRLTTRATGYRRTMERLPSATLVPTPTLVVPQPQEPLTPTVPEIPATPAVPDPGTPGQPE